MSLPAQRGNLVVCIDANVLATKLLHSYLVRNNIIYLRRFLERQGHLPRGFQIGYTSIFLW